MAAMATPSGSVLVRNNPSNWSSIRATPSAAKKPISIASPPTSGTGDVCTDRSLGMYTQPRRLAYQPTAGVKAKVTAAATTPMMR